MRVTLEAGTPWLLFLTVMYYIWGRKRSST
jgi:hypothetical protein